VSAGIHGQRNTLLRRRHVSVIDAERGLGRIAAPNRHGDVCNACLDVADFVLGLLVCGLESIGRRRGELLVDDLEVRLARIHEPPELHERTRHEQ